MITKEPRLANRKKCTGCMACKDSCHKDAIGSHLGSDGHLYVKVNRDKCIGCLACEKACPVTSELNYSTSDIDVFFAAWNKNIEERKRSASGGAFSAMAHYFLDNGGVVFGACVDDICNVHHTFITNVNEIYKLQGSKYTQSDASNSYKDTLVFLKEGKMVLFSGTGCQVAGLLAFLKGYKYSGTLVTVDLICGGIPSRYLVDRFIDNEPYKIKRIISFRTKEHGWKSRGFSYNMKVEDTDGVIHDYTEKRNLVTTAYGVSLTNRYSCYACQFVGTKRMSNFTIGDLWGDAKYPQEHFNGVSLVVSHNSDASKLLYEMRDYLHVGECDRDSACRINYRLVDGRSISKYTIERLFLPYIFSKCSYSTLKKIYANDYPAYSPWMLLKIARYIYMKLLRLIILHRYK